MQIDAHQHFWQIARGDYDWMTDEFADIRCDILPSDLAAALARHTIGGTVVVQAAATVAKTEFLICLAEETGFIKAVVGWGDLEGPSTPETLRRLFAHVLETFGANRLIWGSDWPVLDMAGSYDAWRAATAALLADLPPAGRAAILGGNAMRFYGLDHKP